MIDHVGLRSTKYEESKEFYSKCLKPLGYQTVIEFAGCAVGFGIPFTGNVEEQDKAVAAFWISPLQPGQTSSSIHLAFTAKSRKDVDDFYNTALAAGGKDNGPPGVRAMYHPNYYGAFIVDLEGNNIEAVCHNPLES